MTNKSIGHAIQISLGLGIMAGVLSDSLEPTTVGLMTTLCGLGMIIFGFWGAARLTK